MNIKSFTFIAAFIAATNINYAAQNGAANNESGSSSAQAQAGAQAKTQAQAAQQNVAEAGKNTAAVAESAVEKKSAQSGGNSGRAKPAEKGAPLPLLTLDGMGGVVITPIAYLVNPGAEGTQIGKPSFGATYVNARQKNVESFGVTETLFTRLELGYNASRFGTGSLQTDVLKYAGADIERNDVWLHTFNARFNAIRENDFGTNYLPAITLGVHGKINDSIGEINDNLGGLLDSIGYSRPYGVEGVCDRRPPRDFLDNGAGKRRVEPRLHGLFGQIRIFRGRQCGCGHHRLAVCGVRIPPEDKPIRHGFGGRARAYRS